MRRKYSSDKEMALREMAQDLASDSIVTNALARYIFQLLEAVNEDTIEPLRRELSEAKAEIARLRALLEPFAESAAYYDIFGIYGGVPVRHLREARDALKSDTGE